MVDKKRCVFVLMPFDEEFDLTYEELIRPAFEAADYKVVRADDITNQRNILHDIVVAIHEADIVVADLTDANPNVYYELGLAHALKRKVVLLSQAPSEAPFDLKSYRIIEYGTRHDKFTYAQEVLTSLARDAAAGKVNFGSPVSDYLPRAAAVASTHTVAAVKADEQDVVEDNGQPGLLDSGITIQECLDKISKLTDRVTKHINGLGTDASDKAPILKKLSTEGNMRGARNLLRTMSNGYDVRVKDLHVLNKELGEVWWELRSALEAFLGNPGVPLEQREKLLSQVQSLATNAKSGKDGVFGLVETMINMPPLEALFDKSKRRVVDELVGFSATIEEVESFAGRLGSMMDRHIVDESDDL